MSYDGIVVRSIVHELNKKLIGGKINKIYQPQKMELILNIYNKSNFNLLISANSNNSRIHLTNIKKKNPLQPPMFCMLLRKYLQGGVIEDIKQDSTDRIVSLKIKTIDELGNNIYLSLIVEIMGRHSNIILVNNSNNKIIDSIIRIPEDISQYRQVLPGLQYISPPKQAKYNPLTYNIKYFYNLISKYPKMSVYEFFYKNYLGFSPTLGKIISKKSNIDPNTQISNLTKQQLDNLKNTFYLVLKDISSNNFYPNYYIQKNKFNFHVIKRLYNDNIRDYSSPSNMIDFIYKKKDSMQNFNLLQSNLNRIVNSKLTSLYNKLKKQYEEFKTSKDRERFKVYADLISSNYHNIKGHETSVFLDNFYDPEMKPIKVPLDKKFTPSQNVDRYYKKYTKLKKQENILKKQIPKTKNEIEYLESVKMHINNSNSISDLLDIHFELEDSGYIIKSYKKKRVKREVSKPLSFISSDNYQIFVGKNNKQNDYLTLRFANKEDLWLHVQNIPGSHVVIRKKDNSPIPINTIKEAATLAAYYSKARNSTNVAVDYTEKKNVNKPKGAKLGMVFYENFNTIFVDPQKNI